MGFSTSIVSSNFSVSGVLEAFLASHWCLNLTSNTSLPLPQSPPDCPPPTVFPYLSLNYCFSNCSTPVFSQMSLSTVLLPSRLSSTASRVEGYGSVHSFQVFLPHSLARVGHIPGVLGSCFHLLGEEVSISMSLSLVYCMVKVNDWDFNYSFYWTTVMGTWSVISMKGAPRK